MPTYMRVANASARTYVQNLEPFNGSNTYARLHAPTADRPSELYIVYSYGEHYPMFVAETFEGITKWYENIDRYSQTTSKQRGQLHPLTQTTKLHTADMYRMSAYGIAGVATQAGRY